MCLKKWESAYYAYSGAEYYKVTDKLNGAGILYKTRKRGPSIYEIFVPAEISGLAYKAMHSDLPLLL